MILARKALHTHFFSENLDYGPSHYSSSQKFIFWQAIKRLERRRAEVRHEKRKCFDWIRYCQDTKEAQRDNEKKKVKQEVAFLRRHLAEVRLHMQELEAGKNAKRENAELDKAYHETFSQEGGEKAEAGWNHIEDLVGNERSTSVDMVGCFQLMPILRLIRQMSMPQ